jgi:serine/threonine protein kinase
MYLALTGKRPFEGETSVETMYKHLHTTPPLIGQARPDLNFPKGLDAVIAKALEKERGRRYQTMIRLQQDLEKVASGSVGAILLLRKLPSYRQVIKTLARISTIGNIIAAVLFTLYLIITNYR